MTNEPLRDAKGRKIKGGSRLARYSCWGPKAIAQIGHLPATLRSRCVIIPMQKKMPEELCDPFDENDPVLLRLRRQSLRFVLDNASAIAKARPELPKVLSDRSTQIWEPMVIVADLAGGDWPALAREAAVGLSGGAAANSPVGALLFDIWRLFALAGGGRLFTKTLVQELNRLPDRPWGEKRHGKGITEPGLAEELQPYGIRSRTMRIGRMQAKGYLEEDFQEAFQRYISRSDMDALRAKLMVGELMVDGRKDQSSEGQEEKQKTEVGDQRPEGGEQQQRTEGRDQSAEVL